MAWAGGRYVASSGDMDKQISVEWPTVALVAVIYGGWAAVTFFHAALPLWLVAALGAWLVAWHSSLQHEIVHCPPTRWQRLNTPLALPPLSPSLPHHPFPLP